MGKTENNTVKKLSYDELNKAASDLHMQYQKLMAEYRKVVAELQSRDFTAFLLQMLFKVMEHPEMYRDEFVKWASENIETSLTGLVEAMAKAAEQEAIDKDENKKVVPEKNEA